MGMVPEALDLCVRLMTVQEMATVTSTSTYAYDGRSYKPEVRVKRAILHAYEHSTFCHPSDMKYAVLHGRAWQTEQTWCSRSSSSNSTSNRLWWICQHHSVSSKPGR